MKSDAPRVLRGPGIVEDGLRALHDQIAVVVPHDDVDVLEPAPGHDRAEVVAQKIALGFGLVDARFPRLGRHRLVLNPDCTDGHTGTPIALDDLWVVKWPGPSLFGGQASAV